MITSRKPGKIAYFIERQLLFRFEADSRLSISLDGSWTLDDTVIAALVDVHLIGDHLKLKFIGGGKDQRVLALPAATGSTAVLAQLTLEGDGDLDDVIGDYVLNASMRIAASDHKYRIKDSLDNELILTAVSPNWLSGGSPQTIGTGGPGSRPTPVASSIASAVTVKFPFVTPRAKPKPEPIDVFILDTLPGIAPTDKDLGGAENGLGHVRNANDQAEFMEHPMGRLWLKQHVGQRVLGAEVTGSLVSGVELTRVWADDGQLRLVDDYIVDKHDYGMSDHGLFIAGLIKDIAPKARIHMIQVLGEHGIGSLTMIADGFAKIRALRLNVLRDDARYLVNCSFTLATPRLATAIPPPKAGLSLMNHPSYDLPGGLVNWLEGDGWWEMARLLAEVMMVALDDRAAIVAAAGNDSGDEGICAARFPAALPFVYGVGADNGRGGLQPYSNYPDDPKIDGFATLGEVLGLHIDDCPGPVGGSKQASTGFARWSGTSFATPLITGKLASMAGEYGTSFADAIEVLRNSQTADERLGGWHIVAAVQN